MTYLGYPNTTGLEAMDYRFTDSHADPLADAGQFYTEKLIHLYPTFLSYRPPEHSPDVSMSSANPITFGSLNHLPKINPRVIETWARILQKVPASRLLIKSVTGLEFPRDRRITDLFAKYGDPLRPHHSAPRRPFAAGPSQNLSRNRHRPRHVPL